MNDPGADPVESPGTFRHALGGGAFLASSWTWCIGMFLPVLLFKDFGTLSYLVFAIPNCVGAALMGVFVRNARHSIELTSAHRPMCVLFTLVTQAFQMYFLFWLLIDADKQTVGWVFAMVGLGLLLGVRWRTSNRILLIGGAIALAASLGFGAWWLISGSPPHTGIAPPAPRFGLGHLIPLAAVCVFGFGLSPYLDLTFHGVRQRLPDPVGRAAFIVGFMTLFPLMILMTYLIAPGLISAAAVAGRIDPIALIPLPIALHIGLQLGFTLGAHEGAVDNRPEIRATPTWIGLAALVVGASAGMIALRTDWLAWVSPIYSSPEIMYRLFLSFYGLIFPAYVLTVMIAPRGSERAQSLAKLLAPLQMLAAAFFFYDGFLRGNTYSLIPGIALVLVGAGAVRLMARSTPHARSA